MTFIASDRSGHYQTLEPVTREQIIRFAHFLLTRQFRNRRKITSSEDVRQWLVMKLALENRESFGVIMLSQQHHILGYQTLFTGTLSQTMVYPREIVSLALTHNAAAVITPVIPVWFRQDKLSPGSVPHLSASLSTAAGGSSVFSLPCVAPFFSHFNHSSISHVWPTLIIHKCRPDNETSNVLADVPKRSRSFRISIL